MDCFGTFTILQSIDLELEAMEKFPLMRLDESKFLEGMIRIIYTLKCCAAHKIDQKNFIRKK